MGVIYKHANAERPRLGDELQTLQPLLDRLLAVNPEDRPNSARSVLDVLDATDLAVRTA